MEEAMPNKESSATKSERPVASSIECGAAPAVISARRELEEERLSLIERIQRQESQLAQEPLVTGNDVGDSAIRTAKQEKTLAMLRFWKAHLDEVERAINRMGKGRYGFCERCGCPIPEERLRAFPTAALCIGCARLQTQST